MFSAFSRSYLIGAIAFFMFLIQIILHAWLVVLVLAVYNVGLVWIDIDLRLILFFFFFSFDSLQDQAGLTH